MTSTYQHGDLRIRQGKFNDIPRIIEIFNEARDIMRSDGNYNQWNESYPSQSILESDISDNNGYIIEYHGNTVGYFAFIPGIEKTYQMIYEGDWIDNTEPYATIHRLAGTKESHGLSDACFNWCMKQCRNIRIDTHQDNKIMRHCINKAGFSYCGIIHLENGDERLAYQKIIR